MGRYVEMPICSLKFLHVVLSHVISMPVLWKIIQAVYARIQEHLELIMPSKLTVGVLIMVLNIGLAVIHGVLTGAKKVGSALYEAVTTILVLVIGLFQVQSRLIR